MTGKSDFLIAPDEIRRLVHKNAENSFAHTSYKEELERFRLLSRGDYKAVDKTVEILDADMQGKLSDDPLRNMRYLFIVNTGLATRFAIEAGAPQALFVQAEAERLDTMAAIRLQICWQADSRGMNDPSNKNEL